MGVLSPSLWLEQGTLNLLVSVLENTLFANMEEFCEIYISKRVIAYSACWLGPTCLRLLLPRQIFHLTSQVDARYRSNLQAFVFDIILCLNRPELMPIRSREECR